MQETKDEIDLLEIFRMLWRRKIIIAFFALLAAGIGYFYVTEVAEPEYRASATVALESRESQITDIDALVGGLSAEQPSLNTEIELIRSRQLLRRVVEQEDLLSDPAFNPLLAQTPTYSIAALKELLFGPEEPREYTQEELVRIAVDRLRLHLSVSNPRQSFIFQISITADSPEKAARLANAIAETYIGDQLLFKEEQSDIAIAFLDERTLELQAELGQAELDVKDFASSTDLISPETLAAKNRQVKELRDRILELTATIAALQAQSDTISELSADNLDLAQASLVDDQFFQRMVGQLEDGIEVPSNTIAQAIVSADEQVTRQLVQQEQQKAGLEDAVTDLEMEIEVQSRDLLTLQQLQREADATGEIYLYFLTRLKEAEVQRGTQQADSRLLSSAVVPLRASAPRKALIMAVSLVLGGLLGSVFAMIAEARSAGVRTSDQLASGTGISVLGQLPLGGFRRRKQFLKYLETSSNSAYAEAVRNLRTSVLLSNPDNPPKVILFTSSVPAEGKTTTSISIAHSLANMGKKVLLIEADIRKLTLSEYFGSSTIPSLVKAVANLDDLKPQEWPKVEQGFAVMQGEKSSENAADFFSSNAFKQFLSKLREEFDHIILDSPPILPVADARIAGQHADAILYACGWNGVRIELVKDGLKEFEDVGLTPMGLILTKIDAKRARSYGGATRYGSYYGSYGKGYYG